MTATSHVPVPSIRLPAVVRFHRLLLWSTVVVASLMFVTELVLAAFGQESAPQWYVYVGAVALAGWQLRREEPNAVWLTATIALFFTSAIIVRAITGFDLGIPPTLTVEAIILVEGVILAVLVEGSLRFVTSYGVVLAASAAASASVDGLGLADSVIRIITLGTLYALTAWFIVGFVDDLRRSMRSLESLTRRERGLSEAASTLLRADRGDQLGPALATISSSFGLTAIDVVPKNDAERLGDEWGRHAVHCGLAPEQMLVWTPASEPSNRLLATFADMVASSRDRAVVASELSTVVDSKSQLVSLVSHELRTPLAGILGFAEILRGTRDPDEAAEYLELLTSEAHDMSDIIEDLLTATRAEAGDLTVKVEPVDLADELCSSFGSWRERFGTKGRSLEIRSTPERLCAVADPLRVRQIVRNLLTNAERYGGGMVIMSTARADDTVTISVADDGEGVPAGHEEAIFEAYRRGPGSSPSESVGIGLTLCAELARLQGGSLSYLREDGLTVFRLVLPAAPARVRSG